MLMTELLLKSGKYCRGNEPMNAFIAPFMRDFLLLSCSGVRLEINNISALKTTGLITWRTGLTNLNKKSCFNPCKYYCEH